MFLWAFIALPVFAGCLALLLRGAVLRRGILVGTAFAHVTLTLVAWWHRPAPAWSGWLALDDLGLVFLSLTSLLFAACAVYATGYLRGTARGRSHDLEEGFLFENAPEAVFIGCLLFFLGAMSLVTLARHLGLIWVAVEATTLAGAPLIYFHRHHRSLEAVWKYLLVCSVGIALALLGTFFLAVAGEHPGRPPVGLALGDLLASAATLNPAWLKASVIFMMVGYGAKMGLAPMHTWLPDAHSEAPSPVSALLSGAMLNCALLALLRVQQVCNAAGLAGEGRVLFLALGLFSIFIAAVFVVRQRDYKRLLAYSSVEHMGLIALGVGLGGLGAFGGLWLAVCHALTKAALFLLAGNLLAAYGSKQTGDVQGAGTLLPRTGPMWLLGFLAITGTPPFGSFFGKFTLLKAGLETGHYALMAGFMALVAAIYVGMAIIVLRMVYGRPSPEVAPRPAREAAWSYLPSAALLGIVLLLGVYVPAPVYDVLRRAAALVGGAP